MSIKALLIFLLTTMISFFPALGQDDVSTLLEELGHDVSRLSEAQEFELVVDHLVRDIYNGRFRSLRLLIDEEYNETEKQLIIEEAENDLFSANPLGELYVDVDIVPEISRTADTFVVILTISGESLDRQGNPQKQTFASTLKFIRERRNFWLVESDKFVSNLQEVKERFLKPKLTVYGDSGQKNYYEINQKMLIPKPHNIDGTLYYRLSHSSSNSELGYSLFQDPGHIGCNIHINVNAGTISEYLVGSDPGFGRYLMLNQVEPRTTATANGLFPDQGGIAPYMSDNFYFADKTNDKVVVAAVNNDTWVFFDVIPGLNDPTDVDVSWQSDDNYNYLSFVTANTGENEVIVFPYGETPYVVTGAGGVPLSNPIGSKYGRDPSTGRRINDEYFILDAGNQRLLNVFKFNGSLYAWQFTGFMPNGRLKALAVDAKGYAYVVDMSNAYIYKFSQDLELLGVWGGQGTGDYELDRPRGLVFGQGSEFHQIGDIGYLYPITVSADLLVSEYWNTNTGIRRYVRGTDITSLDVNYIAATSFEILNDQIAIDFKLLDDAIVTTRFIKNGVVEYTSPSVTYSAGTRPTVFYDLGDLEAGEYSVELTAASIYSTNTAVRAMDTYIHRELPYDNCPFMVNEDQADSNSDGRGDVCDFFNDYIPIPIPNNPQAAFIADVNGDSRNDLVYSHTDDDKICIYTNNGDSTFSAPVAYDVDVNQVDAIGVDVDGDDDIDIATANSDSWTISILKNNGSGIFDPPVDYVAIASPLRMCFGRFDADDDADLAITCGNGAGVKVLFNDGSGAFGFSFTSYLSGTNCNSIFTVDVDDNDIADIVVGTENGFTIMFNDGTGAFPSTQAYSWEGYSVSEINVSDIDGDNFHDVILVSAGTVGGYVNDGFGVFSDNGILAYANGSLMRGPIVAADFDGDRDNDIAAIVVNGLFDLQLELLLNNGQGIFPERAVYDLPGYPPILGYTDMLVTADLDGDYSSDLAVLSPNLGFAPYSEIALNRKPIAYVCGDANGDGSVNIGDAVFLINYIFRGGPAPDPLEAGDANCDSFVNLGDAVYIINYAFKGGLAPCCP